MSFLVINYCIFIRQYLQIIVFSETFLPIYVSPYLSLPFSSTFLTSLPPSFSSPLPLSHPFLPLHFSPLSLFPSTSLPLYLSSPLPPYISLTIQDYFLLSYCYVTCVGLCRTVSDCVGLCRSVSTSYHVLHSLILLSRTT